jgi:hypothetical protein
VYNRSAYKNALRLARTEINAAYRRAEWESYQRDPLIKGYRIVLSNNHTTLKNGKAVRFTDICDELQGEYPKSFLWEGWHPQCRCRMVPIVISREELFERMKARKAGRLEEWRPKGAVQDVPDKFKAWLAENAERIAAAEKRGTLPYFLKDNGTFDKASGKWLLNIKTAPSQAAKPVKIDDADTPHPAMKRSYRTIRDVDETLKKINAEFTADKWFEHGDCVLNVERKKGVNGSTFMDGRIFLISKRLKLVQSAMGKIGRGESKDITFDEADAMVTFWHEITHNRNIVGYVRQETKDQLLNVELANEFVARKTLPEFYGKMGCAKTPFPEFMSNRDSTGYNKMVNAYDYVIEALNLDSSKVLEAVRKHLFKERYTIQKDGLVKGLIAGGLKKTDGTKPETGEVETLVTMCLRKDPQTAINDWLKAHGFINQ